MNKLDFWDTLFDSGKYKGVIFPVADNPVNNIPQITGSTSHLFETKVAENREDALELYERVSGGQE